MTGGANVRKRQLAKNGGFLWGLDERPFQKNGFDGNLLEEINIILGFDF